MRILITGATGFIGSHITNQALVGGHEVLALRRSDSSQPSISLDADPLWITRPLNLIQESDLDDVDTIIHLAATGVSPRTASWQQLEEVNIKGTMHLCEIAKATGSRLILAGTFAEYGLSGMRYDKIPPSASLEPTFPYAASKAAAGLLAISYARSENVNISYLRIFNAFGDGQHESNLWPALKKAALQGHDFPMTLGEQVRDFIPVEQVAKAFLLEAEKPQMQSQSPLIRNIGTGKPQTIRHFCEHWWNHWQATGRLLVGALSYREGEVMRFVPEI